MIDVESVSFVRPVNLDGHAPSDVSPRWARAGDPGVTRIQYDAASGMLIVDRAGRPRRMLPVHMIESMVPVRDPAPVPVPVPVAKRAEPPTPQPEQPAKPRRKGRRSGKG